MPCICLVHNAHWRHTSAAYQRGYSQHPDPGTWHNAQVGDSTPVQVIPKNWVYPESLMKSDQLVMFGHSKDRRVHQQGVSVSSTAWNSKPWLMHRSMPNYFTKAQEPNSRFSVDEYVVQATPHAPSTRGAVAVFLHHNKAGGSGVKVALEQLRNFTPGLRTADIFSKSACSYSAASVQRNRARGPNPAFCDAPAWKENKLPACGRCKAPAYDGLKVANKEVNDVSPTGLRGQAGKIACVALKESGRCSEASLKGKCCKTCGAQSCPKMHGDERTPSGLSGGSASKQCKNFKAEGRCGEKRMRGFCCTTCGAESCGTPNIVVGDYVLGVCNVLPSDRPCAYYTMLREPRHRLASSYLHCKYEPNDQLCISHVLDARQVSFTEWVQHQGNYLMRQLMFDISSSLSMEEQYELYFTFLKHQANLKRLGEVGAWIGTHKGNSKQKPKPKSVVEPDATSDDQALLEKTLSFRPNMLWLMEQHQESKTIQPEDAQTIIDMLEYLFAVIGIVDNYDESMKMFETVFRLPFVDAAKHKTKAQEQFQMHAHAGEDFVNRKMIQDDLIRQFDENPELDSYIAWDIKLYERAKEIFQLQKQKMAEMQEARADDTVTPDAASSAHPPEDDDRTPFKQSAAWFSNLKQSALEFIGQDTNGGNTPPVTPPDAAQGMPASSAANDAEHNIGTHQVSRTLEVLSDVHRGSQASEASDTQESDGEVHNQADASASIGTTEASQPDSPAFFEDPDEVPDNAKDEGEVLDEDDEQKLAASLEEHSIARMHRVRGDRGLG